MSSEASNKISTATGNADAGHINEFTAEDADRSTSVSSATDDDATKSKKSASQGVGDGIKGIFNIAHGAGEFIRGNVNQVADKAGEGIASHGTTVGTDEERQANLRETGHAPRDHRETVGDGKTQLAQGIDALKNLGSSEKTKTA